MGATAAIGAGISVVGGLANMNQRNKQASAQKAAIDSQRQIDRLNSDLQLMALEQQQAAAQRQALLNQAVDDEAYLSRQFQIDATQLQNSTALAQAEMDARLGSKQAGISQSAGEQQALDQRIAGDSAASQALAQALGVSSQELQQLGSEFSKRPEKERQRLISNLMDVTSMNEGDNLALQMLTELEEGVEMGTNAKAQGYNDANVAVAEDLKAAGLSYNEAGQELGNTAAAMQAQNQRYQASTSLLDAGTARRTNDAATSAERIAVESAYNSNNANRALQNQARDVTYAANKDVLGQGAKLSAEAASAQRSAVGGAGFFDLLSVGAQGASTYRSLGGDFGFLNKKPAAQNEGTTMDTTGYFRNVG